MPELEKSEYTAKVAFLGLNLDREAGLRNVACQRVEVGFEGFIGESHSGLTRPSCLRVRDLHPGGTDIRNTRQLSILSTEELDQIAANMGVAGLDPCLIGASLVLTGIPDFSHVPPGSRLQSENGTTLVVDLENRPCNFPAIVINEDMPDKGHLFKHAAQNLRGVSASVERPGTLSVGDTLALFIPTQPVWNP